MEENLHARALSAAHEANIIKKYESYSRKQAKAKDIKHHLGLTFTEFYRMEQGKLGAKGPINVYSPSNILLFIRGCADPKVCKKLKFGTLLQQHGKTLDYCYWIAEMCVHLPTYQLKERATACINLFLAENHLVLTSRYSSKVESTYQAKAIKDWAKLAYGNSIIRMVSY